LQYLPRYAGQLLYEATEFWLLILSNRKKGDDMGNYNTTSGFNDLIGSMVTNGNDVVSYYSNARGAGSVHPLGGSGLHFTVSFTGVPRPYNVNASSNGTGFSGHANDNGPAEGEEVWTATASTATPATASN
jgi:hypothetical protein